MWPLDICGGLPGWFCQNTGLHTLGHTPCVHASQLLANGPLCYADRTLVATMLETFTDINSSSPSQKAEEEEKEEEEKEEVEDKEEEEQK